MTFAPTNSGIDADQLFVPIAAPEEPVFVDHLTEVTPTLSLAMPLNEIAAEVVETDVAPGELTVSVGAVVSETGVPTCRVTVSTCETWLDPAVAVTVIVFVPAARAMLEIDHEVLPAALPVA